MLNFTLPTLFVFNLLLLSFNSFASASNQQILPLQQRAEVIDGILATRVEKLMPEMMRNANIDMWILISREYNEDPILKTFLPATWMGARRRTILVFTYVKQSSPEQDYVKADAISTYDIGSVFNKAWDKNKHPQQWQALIELIKVNNPQTIAVNQSQDFPLADGLVATDKDLFFENLPTKYKQRIVSSEPLAVSWIETRSEEEIAYYQQLAALTKDIIGEAFSARVIVPNKTTVNELVWWFRTKVSELGLSTWFQPAIRVQRNSTDFGISEDPKTVILAGDLIHVDFGINYLGLNTDIQQHGYVLKHGETQAPKFLQMALQQGNQLQDILMANFTAGQTGNEILLKTRQQAQDAGLKPMVYSHPIGYFGHSAGTTIGQWDSQNGVAGSGDYPLHNDTAYAIELNVSVYSKEWQKDIMIMLEENALFSKNTVKFLTPRQTQLLLIKAM